MSKIRTLTSSRVVASRQDLVVGGSVSGDNLILTKYDGSTINAGSVRGPVGPTQPAPRLLTATSTSAASIANATVVAVTGWTFAAGDSTIATISGTNFTLAQSGCYVMNFSAMFTANAVGRRVLMLVRNGIEQRRVDHGAGSYALPIVEHILMANAGDIFTFRVYQSSGAALVLTGSPGHDVNILKMY